jgi:hypothetical protein
MIWNNLSFTRLREFHCNTTYLSNYTINSSLLLVAKRIGLLSSKTILSNIGYFQKLTSLGVSQRSEAASLRQSWILSESSLHCCVTSWCGHIFSNLFFWKFPWTVPDLMIKLRAYKGFRVFLWRYLMSTLTCQFADKTFVDNIKCKFYPKMQDFNQQNRFGGSKFHFYAVVDQTWARVNLELHRHYGFTIN